MSHEWDGKKVYEDEDEIKNEEEFLNLWIGIIWARKYDLEFIGLDSSFGTTTTTRSHSIWLSHGNRLVMIMLRAIFSHLRLRNGNFFTRNTFNGASYFLLTFSLFEQSKSILVVCLISERHGRRYSFFNTLKDLLIKANRQHFQPKKCRFLISHNDVLVMGKNGES